VLDLSPASDVEDEEPFVSTDGIIKITPPGTFTVTCSLKANVTFDIEVQPSNSIENVKGQIHARTGLEPANFLLFHDGRLMRNDKSLHELGISGGVTFFILTRVEDDELLGPP
jgi:hypothetical protein